MLRLAAAAVAAGAVVAAGPRVGLPGGTLAVETLDGIHLIDAAGRDRPLPGTSRGDQNPQWSPDGKTLLFWHGSYNFVGPAAVYTAHRDGSGRTRLATGRFPAWSPDGRSIAFEDAARLYVMNADGSGRRRIFTRGYEAVTPAWSPDGTTIAFAALVDGSWRGLATVHLDGTGFRHLPAPGSRLGEPSWSPDGRWIAYGVVIRGKGEVAETAADGSATHLLTHNRVADGAPVWTRDGRHILFSSERDGLFEVFAMDPDGAHQRRLTRYGAIYACCADWRAD